MKSHLIMLTGPGYFGEGVEFFSKDEAKVAPHEQHCQLMEYALDWDAGVLALVEGLKDEVGIIVRSTKGAWTSTGEGLFYHLAVPYGRDLRRDSYVGEAYSRILDLAREVAIERFSKLGLVTDAEIAEFAEVDTLSHLKSSSRQRLCSMAIAGYALERLECIRMIKGAPVLARGLR